MLTAAGVKVRRPKLRLRLGLPLDTSEHLAQRRRVPQPELGQVLQLAAALIPFPLGLAFLLGRDPVRGEARGLSPVCGSP
jgi:hypothetical protein